MNYTIRLLYAYCIGIAAMLMTCGTAWAVEYSITNLGTLGGASQAYGINASGEVVGESMVNGSPNAFLYSGGIMQNLGTLGGTSSVASDINNSGLVVGTSTLASGVDNAFSYSGGSLQNLGTLPSYESSGAFGVNNYNQAVGSASASFANATTNSSGVLFENGTVTLVDNGSGAVLNAINDNGVMVGTDNGQGFMISGSSFTAIPAFCNGTFCNSNAQDINNVGVVVGDAYFVNSTYHAMMYDNGSLVDLGVLNGGTNSEAFGINGLGQIVGTSDTSSGSHAFIYENGSMLDLNSLISPSSGWVLTSAQDINDSGQIVGWGTYDGQTRAFLISSVPLPATGWLFGSGLLGLIGIVRVRRIKGN